MTKTPHDPVNRTEARVAGLPRRCASATIGVVNSMRSNGILSEAQALAELRHHAVMWENHVAALRDGAGRDVLIVPPRARMTKVKSPEWNPTWQLL